MLDTTKWNFGLLNKDSSQWDTNVKAAEQNGQLQIAPLANTAGNHYNGYVSVRSWDMMGAQASVEVVQTTNGPGMSFVVGFDYNNWYRIAFSAGSLVLEDQVNGVRATVSVPYNNSLHRFWRIRHNAVADQIVFETSADRSTWTVQRQIARQLPIMAMRAELSAGTYQAVASPGVAIFDNFQLTLRRGMWTKRNEVVNDSSSNPTPFTYSHAAPFQLDNGTLICGFSTNENSSSFDYKLVRSTDGGGTWGSKVTIAATGIAIYEGSFAQTSFNNLVVVYSQSGGVYSKRSTDRGATWSSAVTVVPSNTTPSGGTHPSLTKLSGGGALLVAYRSNNSIAVKKSTDGGVTWGNAITVATSTSEAYQEPSVVLMPSGNLAMAFVSVQSGSVQPSVYGTRSLNSGSTWSVPVRILRTVPGSFNDPNFTLMVTNGDLVLWTVNGTEESRCRSDSYLLSHDEGRTWPDEGPVYNDGDPHRLNGIQLTNGSMLLMCSSTDGGDKDYHINSLLAPAGWP